MRLSKLVFVVYLAVAMSSCGSVADPPPATGSEPTRSGATRLADESSTGGLDAHVVDVDIDGPLAAGLTVDPHPAGLLVPGEPLVGLLTFTATIETQVPQLVFHTGAATAESGDGVLGHSGSCGHGWNRTGQRRTEEPCAAVEPVTSILPSDPTELNIVLYSRTSDGTAKPGRYTLDIPLDDESRLRVVVDLVPHDASPPTWPEATAAITVSLEEHVKPGWATAVRVEDPFRREYETIELVAPGSVSLRVPAGVFRLVPILANPDGKLVRCSSWQQTSLVSAGDDVHTALLVNFDADGRCAH